MTATRQQFFKPTKATAATKAAETNSVAKGIIEQEAAAREKKTEKLRALRLAQDAETVQPDPAPKRKRK